MINNSSVTRICECQCHDYMYKLVSRIQAANNQQFSNQILTLSASLMFVLRFRINSFIVCQLLPYKCRQLQRRRAWLVAIRGLPISFNSATQGGWHSGYLELNYNLLSNVQPPLPNKTGGHLLSYQSTINLSHQSYVVIIFVNYVCFNGNIRWPDYFLLVIVYGSSSAEYYLFIFHR